MKIIKKCRSNLLISTYIKIVTKQKTKKKYYYNYLEVYLYVIYEIFYLKSCSLYFYVALQYTWIRSATLKACQDKPKQKTILDLNSMCHEHWTLNMLMLHSIPKYVICKCNTEICNKNKSVNINFKYKVCLEPIYECWNFFEDLHSSVGIAFMIRKYEFFIGCIIVRY